MLRVTHTVSVLVNKSAVTVAVTMGIVTLIPAPTMVGLVSMTVEVIVEVGISSNDEQKGVTDAQEPRSGRQRLPLPELRTAERRGEALTV